ncbi:MAG TPA: type II toxin-antitoxin system VapC family toxin [Candidatus Hodarchaeales archaeon]|uniref:PIN domain-containing protein n=2 Tax=Candidatus Chisholmiibacteriota TaxID=1817900 RepID=A0A1G1VM77_9BACT|nr:MAG: hypothetical protein A2785_02045 [Candidatus Chisholmbacteria bacterium RIFCSPHIGHO2_01_FULL_49_18]OGY22603.1 MAG: hypothetical protein A3A65_05860 [Candidatus Chisholmbacteria bacterium RIFCSPLOWO2_01_FULL_49_14]HKZ43386.1 type II toxin-antitoxin system VapC family toxin [Candidatus Hodarchaeales archaeon]
MRAAKIFLETSFFIRFFSRDHEAKYQECRSLLREVGLGKLFPYLSNVVVMEILFILTRFYRFPEKKTLDAIKKILRLRNLTLIEKTDTPTALRMLSRYKVKYGDCLIASQIPKGVTLVSYDKDFGKLGVVRKEPSELLA